MKFPYPIPEQQERVNPSLLTWCFLSPSHCHAYDTYHPNHPLWRPRFVLPLIPGSSHGLPTVSPSIASGSTTAQPEQRDPWYSMQEPLPHTGAHLSLQAVLPQLVFNLLPRGMCEAASGCLLPPTPHKAGGSPQQSLLRSEEMVCNLCLVGGAH